MLLHKFNSFCNNCLQYTRIDPKLQKRQLHPHVFSICRKLDVYPTHMVIEKDTVKMSLINKAELTIFPDKNALEMTIPKEHIAQWTDLMSQVQNGQRFDCKETLHDVISQYDARDIRFFSATVKHDSPNIEVSVLDYNGTKHHELQKIVLTPQGIHIKYTYTVPYDLYKAFSMDIYKY